MAQTAGTWAAVSPSGIGGFTNVDTTAQYELGTRVRVRDTGVTGYGVAELIYLAGVASTVRGSVVLITHAYGTTLLAARDKGGVALALAATVASTWGWYQILGKGVAAAGTISGAGAPVYAGAGIVTTTAVAGDLVMGMRTASTASDNQALVVMATHPAVGDFDNA